MSNNDDNNNNNADDDGNDKKNEMLEKWNASQQKEKESERES